MDLFEDYVSYNTAKLLKEKGFNWSTYRAYFETNREHELSFDVGHTNSQWDEFNKEDGIFNCSAPTLQMAMKWLREVHNLDIIAPPQFDNSKWTYSAIIFKLSIPCTEIRLNDNKDKKEQACEAAIKYCLENLV